MEKKAGSSVHNKKTEGKTYERRWGNQFSKLWNDEEIEKLGDEMVDFFKTNEDALHFTHFCAEKMIIRTRLYEFEKKNEYFAYCYGMVKDMMIHRWMDKGSTAKNGFPIFVLKNISDKEFKDESEMKHSGDVNINVTGIQKI